jgi:hypothetical protein
MNAKTQIRKAWQQRRDKEAATKCAQAKHDKLQINEA